MNQCSKNMFQVITGIPDILKAAALTLGTEQIKGGLQVSLRILNNYILPMLWQKEGLSLYLTIRTFNNSEEGSFRKHFGKRRKCW